jgi:hypothetical protein
MGLEALVKEKKKPVIRGILWQQGEVDARKEVNARASIFFAASQNSGTF